MKIKILLFIGASLSLLFVIGYAFWNQELQYLSPTPKPPKFKSVGIGQKVTLGGALKLPIGNTLLHFYNPDCPCSRFNMKDFERITQEFKGVNFFIIIQSEDKTALSTFQAKYNLDIPLVLDKFGAISDSCGIYSTPQAVILNKNSEVFFKGNYNKTRYCTRKETQFAEIALRTLLRGEQLPASFLFELSEPFGCSLPSDKDNNASVYPDLL